MKYMCGSCCLPTLIFFNPTLNMKMVFGEKIPKMGTFSEFVTILFVKCYNKIYYYITKYKDRFSLA